MPSPAAATATATATASLVRQKYRSLGRLVRRLPEPTAKAKGSSLCPHQSWEQLQNSFREPLKANESVDDRLKQADSKLSFLKMVTPKEIAPNSEDRHNTAGRWRYKDGKRLEGNSVKRDKNGKVISNWDGKNMDPDNVKQHKHQLKRMGFRNNSHAKGFF